MGNISNQARTLTMQFRLLQIFKQVLCSLVDHQGIAKYKATHPFYYCFKNLPLKCTENP